jgi:ABC-type amino acid transport substrate-binding protein
VRGLLRVGFFSDGIPWSFVNAAGELVGYDIEAAHRLASQLGVNLEFVRATRPTLPADLASGRIDLLMSGYTATVSRAQRTELSHAYSSEHVGFLVRDHQRGRFATLATLARGEGLTVAVPALKDARDLVTQLLPDARTRDYEAIEQSMVDPSIDAFFITLERAHYWSRVHPEFAAVQPDDLNIVVITAYAMPYGELDFRNLVDVWIDTRRASGELDEAYEYWVRGRALAPHTPRWSILRNVLGWR